MTHPGKQQALHVGHPENTNPLPRRSSTTSLGPSGFGYCAQSGAVSESANRPAQHSDILVHYEEARRWQLEPQGRKCVEASRLRPSLPGNGTLILPASPLRGTRSDQPTRTVLARWPAHVQGPGSERAPRGYPGRMTIGGGGGGGMTVGPASQAAQSPEHRRLQGSVRAHCGHRR